MNAALSAPSVSSALTVQGRVIAALILREVHTLYGNARLGYLWVIIQAVFSIAVFWGIRIVIGAHAPHGMSMIVFLLSGFIPWQMFSHTVNRCMSAVNANKALLTFPQVTELDLMLARLVVVWGTQLVCAIVILSIAAALGQPMELRHPHSLASTLLFAPLMGLGVGVTFASLAHLWPTMERLVPFLMRFLFFASGVFFSVSRFPSRLRDILLLNPMMQLIEWQRYGFSASASAPMYSVAYIFAWCLGSLCLGLLLERHVRGRAIK